MEEVAPSRFPAAESEKKPASLFRDAVGSCTAIERSGLECIDAERPERGDVEFFFFAAAATAAHSGSAQVYCGAFVGLIRDARVLRINEFFVIFILN